MERADTIKELQQAGRFAFLREWRAKLTRGDMPLNTLIPVKP